MMKKLLLLLVLLLVGCQLNIDELDSFSHDDYQIRVKEEILGIDGKTRSYIYSGDAFNEKGNVAQLIKGIKYEDAVEVTTQTLFDVTLNDGQNKIEFSLLESPYIEINGIQYEIYEETHEKLNRLLSFHIILEKYSLIE
jgi:hypothetical protein